MNKWYKKRTCLKYIIPLVVTMVLVVFAVVVPYIAVGAMPKAEYTIVIDAGHGGRDGGSITHIIT